MTLATIRRRRRSGGRVHLDALLTAWALQERTRLAARPLRERYDFYTHARAVLVHRRAGNNQAAQYVLGTLAQEYGGHSLYEAAAVWTDWAGLETGAPFEVPAGTDAMDVLDLAVAHTMTAAAA